MLNPDRQFITRAGAIARLTEDNPTVHALFEAQRTRDRERDSFWQSEHSEQESKTRAWDEVLNPERHIPGRRNFLADMARQPGIGIPENTYVRRLQDSSAKCVTNPMATASFWKVRITTGPYSGREGWMCEGDLARTVVMP